MTECEVVRLLATSTRVTCTLLVLRTCYIILSRRHYIVFNPVVWHDYLLEDAGLAFSHGVPIVHLDHVFLRFRGFCVESFSFLIELIELLL